MSTGKGIPIEKMRRNIFVAPVGLGMIPTPHFAAQQYQDAGGQLTITSHFGYDPLTDEQKQERELRFRANIPDFSVIFHKLVNGDDTYFHSGLMCLIELTERLSRET